MSFRLEEMPNGEIVKVKEGTTRTQLRSIRAQYAKKPKVQNTSVQQEPVSAQDRQREAEKMESRKRASTMKKAGLGKGFLDTVMDGGAMFGFGDEMQGAVSAGTRGVYNAVTKGDIGEITKEYRISRDADRIGKREYERANPKKVLAAEIGGGLLNPIGAGGVRAVVGALRGGATAAKAGSGTIGRAVKEGARSGAVTGGLYGAGNNENIEDIGKDTAYNAGIGLLAGGALGGVTGGASSAVNAVRDRTGEGAKKSAYRYVADVLDQGGVTPQQAQSRIATADREGGDAMVMDLTPGLTSDAAYISRQSQLPSSDAMVRRGQSRFDERRGRTSEKVRATAKPVDGNSAFDSLAQAEKISGTRKAKGQVDYREGGAMDAPVAWSDELNTFFKESPDSDRLIRKAYTTAQREGQQIATPEGDQIVPTMRVYDYLKREFDGEISKALRVGDNTKASGMSNQLNRLKSMMMDANPKYAQVLAAQRNLFEQQKAIEIGEKAFGAMKSNPRAALNEISSLQPHEVSNARIGIVDAYLRKIEGADDALGPVTASMRNEDQKKLLEFAFGSSRRLRRFNKYIERELSARDADKVTRFAGQSVTGRLEQAGEKMSDGGVVLREGLSGLGFGGGVGLFANTARAVGAMRKSISEETQEQIAKILMSKGDDLVPEIEAVVKYMKARRQATDRAARYGGKAAGILTEN